MSLTKRCAPGAIRNALPGAAAFLAGAEGIPIMAHEKQFYIDGAWVDPVKPVLLDVIDPSTEEAFTQIAIGGVEDVNRAVAAAKTAFPAFARTTRKERIELLRAILAEYNKRRNDMGDAISREMGAPLQFARDIQAGRGTAHLERMIEALGTHPF